MMVLLLMSMFLIKYVLNNFKDLHSLKTGTTQSFSVKEEPLKPIIFKIFIHHWQTDFKELSLQAEL
jgi:hypothetical protein